MSPPLIGRACVHVAPEATTRRAPPQAAPPAAGCRQSRRCFFPLIVVSPDDASSGRCLNSCRTPPIPESNRGRGPTVRSGRKARLGSGVSYEDAKEHDHRPHRDRVYAAACGASARCDSTQQLREAGRGAGQQAARQVRPPAAPGPQQAGRGRARPLGGHGPAQVLPARLALRPATWSSRIIRCGYTRKGYRYWRAGENIYYGSGLYSSPLAVVRAWMKSPAHRAVILTKAFRDVGVGAVKTSSGFRGIDGTVWFFTLDVGRRIAR